MPTQCNQEFLKFHPLDKREVRGGFDGGAITSDAGGLLLREVEKRTGIIRQFAACFRDHRQAERIEHRVEELVAQRVYGLALGYEDLNDHDELRRDPLLGVLAGKADPSGESRARARDQGKALAGKSTLNRLELTASEVKEKRALQEDRAGLCRGGAVVGGAFYPGPWRAAEADRFGPGQHGRSAARESGGALLSRLLWALLLSPVVHLLWGTPVVRAAAHGGWRWGGGKRGGSWRAW